MNRRSENLLVLRDPSLRSTAIFFFSWCSERGFFLFELIWILFAGQLYSLSNKIMWPNKMLCSGQWRIISAYVFNQSYNLQAMCALYFYWLSSRTILTLIRLVSESQGCFVVLPGLHFILLLIIWAVSLQNLSLGVSDQVQNKPGSTAHRKKL